MKSLLIGASLAPLCVSLPAWGQSTPPSAIAPQEQAEGEILVTGSRIRRNVLDEPTPVTTVNQTAIDRSGLTSIADVLQRLSSSAGGINTKFNLSSNSGNPPDGGGISAGSAEIDLRYLSAKRTLVLVDGIRYVNGTAGYGIPASVDLNTIPIGMIDRVEMLQSAATPQYGSDAIAGVVNIITKAKQRGLQASAQVGSFRQGDGVTQDYEFSYGTGGSTTDVVFGGSYVKQDSVRASDRAISRFAVPYGTSCAAGGCDPDSGLGHFVVNDFGNPANAAGLDLTLKQPVLTGRTRFDPANPTGPNSDFKTQTPADHLNIKPYNYVLTPSERYSGWLSVRQEIGSGTTLRARAAYTHRSSVNQAGPITLGVGPGARNGNLLDTINVDATNAFNPFGVTLDAGADGRPSNYQYVARRLVETNGRRHSQTVDTMSLAATLNGSFNLGSRRFYWDANASIGLNDADHELAGNVNGLRAQQALGPAAGCTGACVPLNLFGGPGSITPAMLDYVTFTQRDSSSQELYDYTTNLSGELFDLPAGAVGIAVGYEHRLQRGSFNSDPIVAAGYAADIPAKSYAGRFDVDEVYGEVRVPLFRDVPAIHSLEVNGAVRHSSYSTFGSNTSFSGGAIWKPIPDLLLRGSYAESLRAPSIGELNGSASVFAAIFSDPCSDLNGRAGRPAASETVRRNCVANGVPANGSYIETATAIPVVTGGNMDLQPEQSRTLLFGGAYSPDWARRGGWASALTLEANYYDIKLDNAIASVGADFLLGRCAETGDVQSCGATTRIPSGRITQINARLVNIGGIRTRGLDVNLAYRSPQTGIGSFGLGVQSTFLFEYAEQLPISGGLASVDRVGTERGSPDQAYPRRKVNGTLDWRLGAVGASVTGRYISGVTETANDNRLAARFYGDVQLSYALPFLDRRPVLTVGVNNLFDQDPPACFSCTLNSFDPTTYDLPGQFGYVRVSFRI
ncbi:TonB-dependent receptor domain-containing protein [Sphingomonas montana]|uniref:TonB-dependent receptor domain-containing protein n=1 Tax=Sphingomonas montana TaxID=1843236 RepID=UPI00096E7DBD|nr:TonB-dependent receptor [Sphingomonas montana]